METAFRADLGKGFLVLIKALLIFLFCFISNSIEKGTLVFGLIDFSGRLLWIFIIEWVWMVAALLTILIRSELSEDIRLRIWSCRIASCLESDELIEFQLPLQYNLILMGGRVDLLMFVEKSNRIAE